MTMAKFEDEKRKPRKLVMDPAQADALKELGMTDEDLRELTLMRVIQSALEEQLATENGDGTYTCIMDAVGIVDVLTKCQAYYLGMTRAFDDPKALAVVCAILAKKLYGEAQAARQAFKDHGTPENLHVIEADDPGVSSTVN